MRRPPSSPNVPRARSVRLPVFSRFALLLCLLAPSFSPPAEGFRFDPRVLPPPEPGANAPAIATAPGGPLWTVYRTAAGRPRAARLEPDGTWRVEDLGETGAVRAHPAIAVDPASGTVGIAYYVYATPGAYNEGFLRAARRAASGAWSLDTIEASRPDLRIGRNSLALGSLDGAPWIVASRSTSSLAYLYRYRPGVGWGAGVQLTAGAGSAVFSAADSDLLGGRVVAAFSGSASDPLLLCRAGGPEGTAAETVSFGRPVTHPALAPDPRSPGDLHLAVATADGRELLQGTGPEGGWTCRTVPLSLAPGEIFGGLPALAVTPRTGTVAVAVRGHRGAGPTERLLVAIRRNGTWASFDLGGAAPEEGNEFVSHRAALAVSGEAILVLFRNPAGGFVLAEGRGEPPAPPAPREPEEGAVLTTPGLPAFRWEESVDPEGDPLSYDLYLSRSREAVENLREEARIGIEPGSGDLGGISRGGEIPVRPEGRGGIGPGASGPSGPDLPLEPGVHYWRIVARDRDGLAPGEIRSFTLLPSATPTGLPSPAPTAEPTASPTPTPPDPTPGGPTGPPAPTASPSPSAGPDPSATGSPAPSSPTPLEAGGTGGGCDATGVPGGIGLLATALGALLPRRPGPGPRSAQSGSEAAPRIAASAPRAARRTSSVSRKGRGR